MGLKMTKYRLLVALIAGITVSLPVAAKMYKWVDDKGTTHYGETIPPEYANKDRSVLNKEGRVVKKEEVLTPEEIRAREQSEANKRSNEELVLEQKRRDKALLNTYSNEKEIDLARNRNLQQIEARISSINAQIKATNDKLNGFQKESDNFTKANKPSPAALQEDLQYTQSRLTKLQQDLEKVQAEKSVLDARFNDDKARYRELTVK